MVDQGPPDATSLTYGNSKETTRRAAGPVFAVCDSEKGATEYGSGRKDHWD
jgi:hypothetical protein